MQQMLNKDREELKNNEQCKHRLKTQDRDSTVIEAEKKSELEDIMEMTEAEQNKEEKRTVSETSGTALSTPTFES